MTAFRSVSLRFARDDSFLFCFASASLRMTAFCSVSLRFAQDDSFLFCFAALRSG
jgi:hypothetical protein